MDRVFLDANVLFSSAYKPNSRLGKLWDLPGVELISSEYAVEEARRNLLLARADNIQRFEELLSGIVVRSGVTPAMYLRVELADKDVPILMSAIEAQASHLLTGDLDHFGHLLGKTVHGVLILTPAQYLGQREGSE